MELIPGFALLIAGSVLGVAATVQMGQWNPFGKLPFLIGNPVDYPFGLYMMRTVAMFLLMMGGALIYALLNTWGVIFMLIGMVPAWVLVREHNRQVDKDFGPEWP